MNKDIKELTLSELENIMNDWQEPRFRAKQVFSWVYKKGAKGFEAMSDLPSDLRKKLKENFYFSSLKLIKLFQSYDGTKKFLFELKDKNIIEAVTIPAAKRNTGCVSTQAGCKFACRFCASGLSGFKRNLTSAEILEEVIYLKDSSNGAGPTHIVFMGTGEPLDNYDNVIKAARIINLTRALHIGARRITISSCGIIPGIKKLSDEELQIELSISLHAADDKARSQIMPVNKKYPVRELISACQAYIKKTGRQVTFEYVLIKGLNSDLQSAKKLSRIVSGLNCKVNLIPFNAVRELNMGPPNKPEILLFKDYLLKSGINVTLRKPRGEDIEAACGQLRLRYEKI